ncbi:acetyl-CoA carboxylase carboxyltransferase subunit alpha [Rickettsiales bacterium LUAb2]
MSEILDFESKVTDLQNHINELSKSNATNKDINVEKEIKSLTQKYNKLLSGIYEELTPWQKVQVARHTLRPHTKDYISALIKDFTPLAGDRYFGEDKAIIAGLGQLDHQTVMVIGIEKGNTLESRIEHNFGMPNPEGYRKARRLMELADKFSIPVIALIDTSGAYPGLEAEERGQGEAIARSIEACIKISTPLISIIIGEGGSGGALALGAADMVFMLEHSIYSVISPEGCAAILWKNDQMAQEAAKNLALTADSLIKFGIIDEIIKEPIGGAHRNHQETFDNVKKVINKALNKLNVLDADVRRNKKQEHFLNIGKLMDK